MNEMMNLVLAILTAQATNAEAEGISAYTYGLEQAKELVESAIQGDRSYLEAKATEAGVRIPR